MKKIFLILLLLYSHIALSSVFGVGEMELGLSQEKKASNVGLAGNYRLNSVSSNQTASLYANMQLGTDEGRSLVATSAHEFQYEQSFIQSSGLYSLNLFSKNLTLNSQFDYRSEFETEEDDVSNNVKTKFDKSDKSWILTSGLLYQSSDSKWMRYNLQALVSQKEQSEIKSNEIFTSIGVIKSLSHFSNIAIQVNNICTKYKSLSLLNECRDEIALLIDTTRRYSKFSLKAGYTKHEDNEVDRVESIYSFDGVYNVNSNINFSGSYYKSFDSSIRNTEESVLFNLNGLKTERNGYAFNTQFNSGRKVVEYRLRSEKTTSDIIENNSTNEALYFQYFLSGVMCYSCNIELSYEKAKFSDEKSQIIKSIFFKRKNSRTITTSIGIRQTEESQNVDVWSINYLISYSGLSSRIAGL